MQLRYYLQIILMAACAAASTIQTAKSQATNTFSIPAYTMTPLPDPSIAMPWVNGTFNATRLPQAVYLCSNPSGSTISRDDIDAILNGEFLQDTIEKGMADSQTGYIWRASTDAQSTQVYICNFNPLYDVPFSAGEYRLVGQLLDEKCGGSGGWAYFDDWRLQIGRDVTDSAGGLTGVCGWTP